MNGHEFLKKLRRYGKSRGLVPEFVARQGKGSHGTVLLGQHRTTLKDRRKEIGKGLLAKMLADLCIDPNDF
ncbi:MAG: hypothetical protein HOK21_10270 [Rhodospirillaceae bacterium]|jgi:mRNA interferase HicA|nr:hypothetical protein [Rhodospirillaceae bacterium]MBT7488128.1 hypothetical protein [Rhodospirillales bacterium]MBT5083019.1 hypothetical protein [Rhodospirillaceae bacterium]MBT5524463.1 hypothetical protein [Rhodospirillaceae bacterium]MBT5878741.1 hypothetical protein [Rhodospirillaceae bacterium]